MRTEKLQRGIPGWKPYTEGSWGKGPWDDEPDKAHWVDEATGLDCLAVRNLGGGFWCGYVGVPQGHPAYGKSYDDLGDVAVHGGLTYAAPCRGNVCHVPEPGRPDTVWWLGFDCAHSGDFSPHSNSYVGDPILGQFYKEPYDHLVSGKLGQVDWSHEVYRTFEYVQEQCKALAAQLKEM